MSRRVAILASEILGMQETGGAATADSLLAVALGRHGHDVEVLVAPGRPQRPLTEEWSEIYRLAGVRIRRLAGRSNVRPPYLEPTAEMLNALRVGPPDVVVTDEWRGLGYAPLRTRQLGLGLTDTAFVVHCHGPARMLAEFAQKVPDTLARFGEEVAERAAIELADAVVSPSKWLLDWMSERGWPAPESAAVIPYVRQSEALEQTPPRAPTGSPVRRLAFFGQLREGKGIRTYLAALEALEPAFLDGSELVFLGRETPRWTTDRILSSLSSRVRQRVTAIRFETELEQAAALVELSQLGTLAVMPSLLDNAPNTVSECLERGIPFVATKTGGIPELVADEDHTRVLCRPTSDDLAAALTRALTSERGFAPARPAREPRESLEAWLELIETVAPSEQPRAPGVTRVAVVSTGQESARRARRLSEHTRTVTVEVVPAGSRLAGFAGTSTEWVVFLDDDDTPDDQMLDTLVAAQAASDADVVTAAVRPADDPDGVQLFLGSPGALGLVENQYGVVGLVRRSLLATEPPPDGAVDPDWLLLARLALAGARIVSIPEALSSHSGRVGKIDDVPGDGLTALRLFELADGKQLPDLPQLTATLAAAHGRLLPTPHRNGNRSRHIVERLRVASRAEGARGITRRFVRRILSTLRVGWT